MECSYKFRLYPTREQAEQIQKTFGCCRFVWNHYLYLRKKKYKENGYIMNYYECSKDMTGLKKDLTWLRDVESSALQSSIRNLDTAFKNFFRCAKKGEKTGFPRFKSKKSHRQSYKSSSPCIRTCGNLIRLPKLGFVKCRISRKLRGRIISATVSQDPSGKYFVAVCCTDVEFNPLPSAGKSTCLSVGNDSLNKLEEKNKRKISRLQRQLSRKSKGSMRREKARIKFARFHEHIANQRRDAIHKLSISLIRDYDTIVVRRVDLEYPASDACGELRRQLKYKSEWYGKQVVFD